MGLRGRIREPLLAEMRRPVVDPLPLLAPLEIGLVSLKPGALMQVSLLEQKQIQLPVPVQRPVSAPCRDPRLTRSSRAMETFRENSAERGLDSRLDPAHVDVAMTPKCQKVDVES